MSGKVRRANSLIVTDKATPATSNAAYFDSLTTALNEFFPIGENPGASGILAPTTGQLVIQTLPLPFLPSNE